MDSKEIAGVVESVSNEKDLPKEKVFEALEFALAVATKNFLEKGDILVRVHIDTKTCDYKAYRRWLVVEDKQISKPLVEITLSAAKFDDPTKEVGDYVEEEIDLEEAKTKKSGFDRIAAQTAKNVIVQKLRDAEKERIINSFKDKVGHMVQGTVKKKSRDSIVLDLSSSRQRGMNAEAVMTRDNWLKNDNLSMNQRLRAVLLPFNERSGQLSVSRTTNEFLIELIKNEVPEVNDGFVEIRAVARDAGNRSKIAVLSKDKRIDAVGACVGMRKTRINAILEELSGENIDIVLWDADPVRYVFNAMAPAKIEKVSINEENHVMDLSVTAENKPYAIGKSGVNVRLASKLTGWNINVYSNEEFDQKLNGHNAEIEKIFMEKLNIDEEFAEVLVREGFETLDTIAYVDPSELTAIDGIDEDIANALQESAKAVVESINNEAKDLLDVEGVDIAIATSLIEKQIKTKDDLAELATDELMDICGVSKEKAGDIILAARTACHWFDEE